MTALFAIAVIRQCKLDRANAILHAVGDASRAPLEPAATEDGLREAVTQLTKLLESRPEDLLIRWLLNLAYMSLGEYPRRVPSDYVIPIGSSQTMGHAVRFENIAPKAGLGAGGPTMAGGSLFDDFTGDRLPDLLITSLDTDRGATLYVNRGDGKFADRSGALGSATRSVPSEPARPTMITTVTSTFCWCAVPAKSRCGPRCCATTARVSSRMLP